MVLLSSFPEMLVCAVLYVLMVVLLPRVVKPFGQLDLVLGLHNTILCIFSIVMFTGVLFAALAGIRSSSLFDVFCDARGEHFGGPIYYWLHVFYISKVVEFLDTLLLILRGRPVTFLHSFHHLATFVICWVGLDSRTTYAWIAMLGNTFVHTFMYAYFAFDAFTGKKFWWAKYLTQLQMAQFLINLSVMCWWAILNVSGVRCSGDWTGLVLCGLAMIVYFYLFSQLFKKKYVKSQ